MTASRWPLALGLALLAGLASAVPPPDLPLPACRYDNGVKVGACDDDNPLVWVTAPGAVGPGQTMAVGVDASVPPCSKEVGRVGAWSPSRCYSGIGGFSVGCAVLDLRTDTFRTGSCAELLYGNAQSPEFTFAGEAYNRGPVTLDRCLRGEGAFSVYIYGGPANVPGATWPPVSTWYDHCDITFDGPPPDALVGPTWLRITSGIDLEERGDFFSEGHSAATYVSVTGDLLDVGPVAAFVVAEGRGPRVRFDNRSTHTFDERLTYRWDFGDGTTSSVENPRHTYRKTGEVTVTLTATDRDGDEDSYTQVVDIDYALPVELQPGPTVPEVGEPFGLTLTVTNPHSDPIEGFVLSDVGGLRFDPAAWAVLDGPMPAPPARLSPGASIGFTYALEPLRSGRLSLQGRAAGYLGDLRVEGDDRETILVPARLEVALSSTVDAQTAVGDTFDVIATITNREKETIEGIEVENLEYFPTTLATVQAGPLSEDGTDPRVQPVSLPPQWSTTVSWTLQAETAGVANLRANVSGRDPFDGSLFFVSADKRLAIETAAIEVSELRLSPGAPTPGQFGTLRGTVSNIGSIDVTDLTFDVAGAPGIERVDPPDNELDPEVAPEQELLEAGAAHAFVVPVVVDLEVDELATFRFDVTLGGTAEVDGEPVDVEVTAPLSGGLDLTEYWTSLLADLKRFLFEDVVSAVDAIDELGESSDLGGIAVGTQEGCLSAFQKMGDGLLTINDLLGYATGAGGEVIGEQLTETGKLIAERVKTYRNTHTKKEMLLDLEGLTVDGVDVFASWMYDVETAYDAGDYRTVSALIAEPTTEIAVGVTAEIGFARVVTKLGLDDLAKKTWKELKKAPEPLDEAGGSVPYDRVVRKELQDLEDMPTGVALTGETVARVGLTVEEHAWMIRMAKEHNVAFFVRPRPENARRFAQRGFNGKPVQIKEKSVNDIDLEWLGFDEVNLPGVDDIRGLVVVRKPKDPLPALKAAVERGDIEWGGPEIDQVLKRYNKRRAEHEAFEARLAKLNADDGITVRRYGKDIKTKVIWDTNGVVRFEWNNQPVFSDIDLLHIARPDGSPIPKQLHDFLSRQAGNGIDSQHGDTFSTSDFPDWQTAKGFVEEYGAEHQRGGDGGPLLVVQPQQSTLGYVDQFTFPDSAPGGGGELFGLVRATYEGAAPSCSVGGP